MNVEQVKEWQRHQVCGDCARRMVEEGGVRMLGGVISLGASCEAHPSEFRPQATSVVRVPPEWRPPAPPPPRVVEVPGAIGPLTEISLRLLCAWTNHEDGMGCGTIEVEQAVNVATMLLERTKGR